MRQLGILLPGRDTIPTTATLARTTMRPETQREKDNSDLHTLAICHYTFAGLMGLLLLTVIGLSALAMFNLPPEYQTSQKRADLDLSAIVIFGAMTAVFLLSICLVLFLGRKISKRKHLGTCTTLAGLECLILPFGPILGVATLKILGRESVKLQFGVTATPPPLPPGS